MRLPRLWTPIALLTGLILIGCNIAATGPSSPPTTAAASQKATQAGPRYPSHPPEVLASPLPEPDGEPLTADLIGRTYRTDPPEVLSDGAQQAVLRLRAADDPHCVGIFGGQSTCFTVLWEPNGPKTNDPAARGSARIVGGNLVLGFAWVPYDTGCERTFGTFAIEDGGSTLRGITSACGYNGFRAITLAP